MKDKLFQLFFCFFIFWNTIISAYLNMTGETLDGGIMRVTLMFIAVLSWIFYLSYHNNSSKEKTLLFFIFIFGMLFYSTRFFYYNVNPKFFNLYNGQILRWGADCVSASLIGMTLTKLKSYSLVHKILPWECLALTPFMAIAVLTMGHIEGQLHMDSGMNYQTIAYAMAVLFCFSFYYAFIYRNNHQGGVLIRLIMIGAMLVQSVCCAMAGGRGGLILLIVYVFYMTYYMLKSKVISKSKLMLVLIIATLGFILVANYFSLWTSSGFARSSNGINNDDRFALWVEYLPYIEQHPLFGNGLGSDYFTWGFYSHNIFVDWLVETGVVGVILLSLVFIQTYKRLFALTNINQIFVVIMILFIYGAVMNMFSGYWITTNVHWLAFGIVLSRDNYFRTHEYV